MEKAESIPLQHRIAEADAFVIVTPEYNHGYPRRSRPLSILLDLNGRPSRLHSSLTVGFLVDCARWNNCAWCLPSYTR